MEQTPAVDLDKLEQYLNAERAKAERAKRDAIRAQMDRLEEEREAKIAASRQADREKRDAGDKSLQAAKMIREALGSEFGAFMKLLASSNVMALKASLARLERERVANIQDAGNRAAPTIRVAAETAKKISIATEIEMQLRRAGVLAGLTPDTDLE